MKKTFKEFVVLFCTINTGVMFATAIYISLFEKEASLHVSILWQMLLVTFLTSLSDLLYYSKKELSKKQAIIRTCIQFILVSTIVIVCAYLFDWIDPTKPLYYIVSLIVLIIIVYILVKIISYKKDMKMAEKLNEKIAEYNRIKKNN
ncbi:DUF3021 domain-containing protein [Inconstantimicrobium mannanitabidum]|uniref:Uncharacterized protein n=1 Tax=Inconstantimicrobium mannanitabidum TaxID=1604901 RepID=A0ACB5RD20_9CLOT|nr:DUF3021 domain-containing protein [Clostridium sp. TW13]GKX67163.1 hypothetical protein rsdtw13_24210 [Clostridium sp. TW13]